jgi:hypothetical protein
LVLGQFADSLVGTRTPGMPLIRRSDSAGGDPRPVTDLLQETGTTVIFGRTGTGKSTAAELLRRDGARQEQVVLVASAEAYIPGCLPALAADAISEVLGEDLPAATGRQALADRGVTLVIDGVSEVPTEMREGLHEELRAPQAAGAAPGLSCSAETFRPSGPSCPVTGRPRCTAWWSSIPDGSLT